VKVIIYGLFHQDRCVYVGQTRDPKARESCHRKRFSDLRPEFRVLRTVSESKALQVEHSIILKYRKIGQAEHNRQPFPKKTPINLSINRVLAQFVAVFVINSDEWRSVSELTESLWRDFLKQEGAL
jgi:hypothetical protein